jgi:AcrR family transcriptional regulator
VQIAGARGRSIEAEPGREEIISMELAAPHASRREQAKEERRTRIVDAAHALLREIGIDKLSIKLIADRAAVSPATIYNLFGVRGAVLVQVFDRDLQTFQAMVDALPSQDALERIFDAIHVSVQLYRKDQAFYRATMTIRGKAGSKEADALAPDIIEPRTRFWVTMIEQAVIERFMKAETHPRLVGVTLTQIVIGAISDWVCDLITLDRLELEICFGFSVILRHYATPLAAARLSARIERYQALLAAEANRRARHLSPG